MSGRILHSERREKSTVQGRPHTDLYDQNQTAARCGSAGECQGTGNLAYALKVKISNLQKMAETLVWVQENNINDLTELNDLCKTAQANAQAAYERLSQAEDELYKTNEQIHYAGQYLSTKEVQQQFTKAIFKKNSVQSIPRNWTPMQNP